MAGWFLTSGFSYKVNTDLLNFNGLAICPINTRMGETLTRTEHLMRLGLQRSAEGTAAFCSSHKTFDQT